MAAAPASTGTAARDAPVGSTGPATTANRLLPHPLLWRDPMPDPGDGGRAGRCGERVERRHHCAPNERGTKDARRAAARR